jgi:hypothetical protein
MGSQTAWWRLLLIDVGASALLDDSSTFEHQDPGSAMSIAKLSNCSDMTILSPRSSRMRLSGRASSRMIEGWTRLAAPSSSRIGGQRRGGYRLLLPPARRPLRLVIRNGL